MEPTLEDGCVASPLHFLFGRFLSFISFIYFLGFLFIYSLCHAGLNMLLLGPVLGGGPGPVGRGPTQPSVLARSVSSFSPGFL